MAKEICISTTPHETRLAILEDDQLTEIYYERENEYTLAGSIYKGRVTRVLPGMQSAFVDLGLERDAFLYVTDFMEEQEDSADFEKIPANQIGRNEGQPSREPRVSTRDVRASRPALAVEAIEERNGEKATPADVRAVPESGDGGQTAGDEEFEQGTRRWRGRRGRRRGGRPQGQGAGEADSGQQAEPHAVSPQELRGIAESISAEPVHQPERGAPGGIPAATLPIADLPIVLPGESLSRYGGHAAEAKPREEPRASAPAASSTVHFKPSTLVEAPLAWDGGTQLPGESISRYRHDATEQREPLASPVHDHADKAHSFAGESLEPVEVEAGTTVDPEPISDLTEEDRGSGAVEPALPGEPVEHHAYGSYSDPSAAIDTQAAAPEFSEFAPPPDSNEQESSEPESASASYRVDTSAPSEYRVSSTLEDTAPVQDSPAPEPTLAVYQNEAIPQTAEEEVIQPHLESLEQALEPPRTTTPEQSLALEYEEQTPAENPENDRDTGHVELNVQPSLPGNTAVGTYSVTEDESPHSSGQEFFDETENDEDMEDGPQGFAPGTGPVEEEIIDEDEYDFEIIGAQSDEHDLDELEEETLDNQGGAELSEMVREAHLNQRISVQNAPAVEIEEEEGEEDYEPLSGEEETETEGQTAVSAPAPSRREGRQDDGRRGGRSRHRRRPNGGGGGPGRRASAQLSDLPIISELLKQGQEILVQIAKEPIAKKGARITSHIALPGRFLVFMPTVNHVGVSRKISSDDERQRLKRILISEKGTASGGFIVRTAADGASEEDLRADIRFLISLWTDIKQRADEGKAPALIYHDLNLIERILRDQVSDNFSTIWVDTESEYERIVRFLNRFQPSLVRRVKLYTKETPLFEQFGIQEEISKALKSKVWLKSGGSIVINQTEALVAIDINTGKYVGKTARLEDTILKTNLDAIPEIVRQIRLRDLGGIIVIDFIDMDERKNRHKVMLALEEELKSDRAPSKVLQFNDFGLVAITRKRVKQSLERTLSVQCEVCAGTGMVKSPTTVCNEIYIEMRKMQKHLDKGDVLLRVHPEVVKTLKSNNARWLNELEEMLGKTIIVKSDPALHPEQFDIH